MKELEKVFTKEVIESYNTVNEYLNTFEQHEKATEDNFIINLKGNVNVECKRGIELNATALNKFIEENKEELSDAKETVKELQEIFDAYYILLRLNL